MPNLTQPSSVWIYKYYIICLLLKKIPYSLSKKVHHAANKFVITSKIHNYKTKFFRT